MSKMITKAWLLKHNACGESVVMFTERGQAKWPLLALTHELIKADRLEWANWLLTRSFTRRQNIQYAIFAAEQVLDIYENQYPLDKRPRLAIEAAKLVLKRNSAASRAASWAASEASWAASEASSAASAASRAAIKKMQLKIINYGLTLLGGK